MKSEETTKTTKHTPGPWTLHPRVKLDPQALPAVSWNRPPVVYHDGTVVCTVNTSAPDLGEREANARLIALMPEMLEALEYISGWSACQCSQTHGDNPHCAVLIAERVLAKVDGRE